MIPHLLGDEGQEGWFWAVGHFSSAAFQVVFNRTVTLKEDPGKV